MARRLVITGGRWALRLFRTWALGRHGAMRRALTVSLLEVAISGAGEAVGTVGARRVSQLLARRWRRRRGWQHAWARAMRGKACGSGPLHTSWRGGACAESCAGGGASVAERAGVRWLMSVRAGGSLLQRTAARARAEGCAQRAAVVPAHLQLARRGAAANVGQVEPTAVDTGDARG